MPRKKSATTTPPHAAEPRPVVLYPHQEEHVVNLVRILSTNYFAIDLSMLGAGKTYTATKIGELMGVKHVVVVAPVSVGPKWEKMKRDHGLPLEQCVSFAGLRSAKFREPKHGLLTRRDFEVEHDGGRVIEKVEFKRTDAWDRMVEEGALLIIDEIQNIKNLSEQFHACRELIRAVSERHASSISRVLLVSGSPIDKQEQAVHLFRGLGVMTKTELCRWDPKTYTMKSHGFDEIVKFCSGLLAPGESLGVETRFFSPAEFFAQPTSLFPTGQTLREWRREFNTTGRPAEALPAYIQERFRAYHDAATRSTNVALEPMSATVCQRRAYRLFQGPFKKHVCASMTAPTSNDIRVNKRNGYFAIRDDQVPLLTKGVTKLSDASETLAAAAAAFAAGGGGARGGVTQVHYAIMQAMTMIETAKLATFSRLVASALDSDPNRRVVVCLNFSDTLKDLVAALEAYRPVVMTGGMSAGARGQVIDAFQANTQGCRLLIGNTAVLSTGIDLDDKDGRFPRTVFVSPNYNTITLYQLSHRFVRLDSKSSADLYMVYGAQIHETKLLAALGRKSQIMKETTPDQVASGVVFPCDFEPYYEIEPCDSSVGCTKATKE